MKIVIVNVNDDWQELWIDGVLHAEGHRISAITALEIVCSEDMTMSVVEKFETR